jgi:hypothetical protein
MLLSNLRLCSSWTSSHPHSTHYSSWLPHPTYNLRLLASQIFVARQLGLDDLCKSRSYSFGLFSFHKEITMLFVCESPHFIFSKGLTFFMKFDMDVVFFEVNAKF